MPRVTFPATLACAAFALAFGLSADVTVSPGSGPAITFAPTAAEAQTRGEVRRTARRTSRRTTRRQDYIRSLPSGCVRRGAYYYCGGIYYSPVVQDGATVYIVVNP